MFVRQGAVTPGPSREGDITFFVQGRPNNCATVRRHWRAGAARHRTVIPGNTRMLFPQVTPVEMFPIKGFLIVW